MSEQAETFDQRVQRVAEAHLTACFDAMYEFEEHSFDGGDLPISPAHAPFDGCNTCIVREVLAVTYDELLKEARREAKTEES